MDWQIKFKENLIKFLYNPNQPRDKDGKWTSSGGGIGSVSTFSSGKAQDHIDNNISVFASGGGHVDTSEYHAYLSSMGISNESQKKLDDLLNGHTRDHLQVESDLQLEKHWKNQDEVADGLRYIDVLERNSAQKVAESRLEKHTKKLKDLEKVHPDKVMGKEGLSFDLAYDAMELTGMHPVSDADVYESYWKNSKEMVEFDLKQWDTDKKYGNTQIYRKSRQGSEPMVQSWTLNKSGADTQPLSGGKRITPNKIMKLSDLGNDFLLLSGFARQRGYGGEGEVTVLEIKK